MYLGASKYWWAYLALKSNPSLLPSLEENTKRAIFFDDPSRVSLKREAAQLGSTRLFFILWDGILDAATLQRVASLAESSRGMVLLTVGDQLRIPINRFPVRDLFAQGQLNFDGPSLPLDRRTRLTLMLSRVRNLLMPLKNMSQAGVGSGLDLLFGMRRLVFCGSYGIVPEVLRQLCERHDVDTSHFRQFRFYTQPVNADADVYEDYLREAGRHFAHLFQKSILDANFLFSAAHVLGREYCLRQMSSAGLPLFCNGYATGVNINVYTTPFYAQHVFPDFGSAVGTGNYPRLADLTYYRKKTVPLDMTGDLRELAEAAANGLLDEYFHHRWRLYEPALKRALGAA